MNSAAAGDAAIKSGSKFDGEKVFESCFVRWSIEFSTKLERKFYEAKSKGYVEDFPEYLSDMKSILEKPYPKREEFEKYVPADMDIRSKYFKISDDLEDVPDHEPSRSIFIRMWAGAKYERYKEKAREIAESLDNLRELSYSTCRKRGNESHEPRFLGTLHRKLGTAPYIVFIVHLYILTCFLVTFGIFNLV